MSLEQCHKNKSMTNEGTFVFGPLSLLYFVLVYYLLCFIILLFTDSVFGVGVLNISVTLI